MARILLFEDDLLSQQLLLDALEEGGHTALLGRLDATARQQLRTAAVDLVLTDLRLRTFSGWDVLDWIGEDRPGLPVIGISGAENREPERHGQPGFVVFLLKPIDTEVLLRAIDAATRA